LTAREGGREGGREGEKQGLTHIDSSAVLDATGGVQMLGLGEDTAASDPGEGLDLDEGGIAHCADKAFHHLLCMSEIIE